MSIIEFEEARYSYDGTVQALDSVTTTLEAGSFTCVLGGNGSGKSTFAKHINALLVPDGGTVRVLGLDTADPANTFAVRSDAGMVFQNPDDQIVASIIENDVAFGPENLGVAPDEIHERVETALAQVGLQGFGKKQTEALSGGQKQRVAVAGVLAMEPQILLFDEASAMLDPRGRAGLLRVCRELNDAGMTVVVITHFMEEAALADRVIVLDGGRVAMDGTPGDVLLQADRLAELALDVPFATRLSLKLRDLGAAVGLHADDDGLERELVGLIAGGGQASPTAHPAGASPATDPPAGSAAGAAAEGGGSADNGPAQRNLSDDSPASGAPLIEFENVSFTYEPVSQERRHASSVAPEGKQADWGRSPDEYWALRDVSFQIREGEFFGIAGHTGSGKSTLIQLANGLLKSTAGTVRAAGRDLSDSRAAAEVRRDIGVVFQYPEHQLFAATVFEDVAFGPRNLGYPADEVERRVRRAMDTVHLDLDALRGRSPFALSGGQQRRVAFAGVLAMEPRALVLDEPMAGLDPRARQQFLDLLAELHRERGMTVAVVSHNMDDLALLCDRILVLNEGRTFALGGPEDVFADEAALRAIGLGVPRAAHMAARLAAAGIPLPVGNAPDIDELAQAIAARLGRP